MHGPVELPGFEIKLAQVFVCALVLGPSPRCPSIQGRRVLELAQLALAETEQRQDIGIIRIVIELFVKAFDRRWLAALLGRFQIDVGRIIAAGRRSRPAGRQGPDQQRGA